MNLNFSSVHFGKTSYEKPKDIRIHSKDLSHTFVSSDFLTKQKCAWTDVHEVAWTELQAEMAKVTEVCIPEESGVGVE